MVCCPSPLLPLNMCPSPRVCACQAVENQLAALKMSIGGAASQPQQVSKLDER